MNLASRQVTQNTIKFVLILSLAFLLLVGCQSKELQPDTIAKDPTAELDSKEPIDGSTDTTLDNADSTSEDKVDASIEPTFTDEQLKELHVNELGDVMVLMYHKIGDKEDEWERTVDNFKNDLKVLYEENYYLVTARDFVTGNMDVPAGKSPVVLTFDDGRDDHFRFIEKENGELIVDPDSAVGIIENFANEHPDFGLAATFYVYYPIPFRQQDRPEWRQLKYEYLENIGMEIGNHTYGHENLSKLTDEEVQKALAKNVRETQKLLPGYSVDTFALTYGINPKNRDLNVKGSYDGTEYHHKGVFLVGSRPAPSPYSSAFKSDAIPRIRAASVPVNDAYLFHQAYIDSFRNNPERRYVSDGDPNTITVPAQLADMIDIERFSDKTIRTY